MNKFLPYILSFILVLGSFLFHLTDRANSLINNHNQSLDTEYFIIAVDYHKSHVAFAKRPVTTFLVENFASLFNTSLGLAFVIINYFFLFVSGIILYKLSMQISNNQKFALFNLIIYFLSFSNLFAFFPPIYTYDEPLQFCLIFLSFIFLLKNNWVLYIITFSFSLITRESGLLLIPSLAIFLIGDPFTIKSYIKKENLLKLLLLISPLLIYLVFIKLFLNNLHIEEGTLEDIRHRFDGFIYNFQNINYSIETLGSFILALGIPIYLLLVNRNNISKEYQKYTIAFWVTLIINSLLVILFTRARETRLFILPMFFLWPVFGQLFFEDFKLVFTWSRYIQFFKNWKCISLFLIMYIINYLISFIVYNSNEGSGDYFNEYLFISFLFISVHFLFKYKLPYSEPSLKN